MTGPQLIPFNERLVVRLLTRYLFSMTKKNEPELVDGSNGESVPSKPVTPLPKMQIFLICCVQMAEAMNVELLFPFLAFMVEDMGYTGNQLGYHAGILAATFCGAQFCTSVAWGMISDRYGRKFAIVSGTLGAGLGMLIFGFSKTFTQAIIGRVIGGLLCGNLGVVKSFLTEITDDTNRSNAFYFFSLSWTVGSICAPLFGGLLCKPAEKYPTVFPSGPGSMWVEFPYLLPCLLTVFVNVFGATMCMFFMVETVGVKKDHVLVSSASSDSSGVQSVLHCEMDSLEEGVQMSTTLFHSNEVVVITDSPRTTRGRSSSIASVDNSTTLRARGYSMDKHNTMSVGGSTHKQHKSGEYSRLPVQSEKSTHSDDDYSPMSNIDLDHSTHLTHKPHTIDRSTDHAGANTAHCDTADAESGVFQYEDPDEICCPTFFDTMAECGRYLICANKSRSLDSVSMESSRHDLIHTDSSSSLNTTSTDTSNNANTNSASNKLSTSTVLTQRAVILATSTYGMVCASSILVDETLPLFLKLDTQHGGFGFSSTEIGTLLSSGAAGMFVLSMICMPMTQGMSNKFLSKASIAISAPLCLAFPIIALLNNHVLAHMRDATAHTWLLWPLLILINTFKNLANCFAFTTSVIMVNHSVTDEYLGTVNGLGQSLGALARCLGPAVGGLLWSVATKYDFVYLNFIAITVTFGLNYYVSYLVPDALDHRKKGKTR